MHNYTGFDCLYSEINLVCLFEGPKTQRLSLEAKDNAKVEIKQEPITETDISLPQSPTKEVDSLVKEVKIKQELREGIDNNDIYEFREPEPFEIGGIRTRKVGGRMGLSSPVGDEDSEIDDSPLKIMPDLDSDAEMMAMNLDLKKDFIKKEPINIPAVSKELSAKPSIDKVIKKCETKPALPVLLIPSPGASLLSPKQTITPTDIKVVKLDANATGSPLSKLSQGEVVGKVTSIARPKIELNVAVSSASSGSSPFLPAKSSHIGSHHHLLAQIVQPKLSKSIIKSVQPKPAISSVNSDKKITIPVISNTKLSTSDIVDEKITCQGIVVTNKDEQNTKDDVMKDPTEKSILLSEADGSQGPASVESCIFDTNANSLDSADAVEQMPNKEAQKVTAFKNEPDKKGKSLDSTFQVEDRECTEETSNQGDDDRKVISFEKLMQVHGNTENCRLKSEEKSPIETDIKHDVKRTSDETSNVGRLAQPDIKTQSVDISNPCNDVSNRKRKSVELSKESDENRTDQKPSLIGKSKLEDSNYNVELAQPAKKLKVDDECTEAENENKMDADESGLELFCEETIPPKSPETPQDFPTQETQSRENTPERNDPDENNDANSISLNYSTLTRTSPLLSTTKENFSMTQNIEKHFKRTPATAVIDEVKPDYRRRHVDEAKPEYSRKQPCIEETKPEYSGRQPCIETKPEYSGRQPCVETKTEYSVRQPCVDENKQEYSSRQPCTDENNQEYPKRQPICIEMKAEYPRRQPCNDESKPEYSTRQSCIDELKQPDSYSRRQSCIDEFQPDYSRQPSEMDALETLSQVDR